MRSSMESATSVFFLERSLWWKKIKKSTTISPSMTPSPKRARFASL